MLRLRQASQSPLQFEKGVLSLRGRSLEFMRPKSALSADWLIIRGGCRSCQSSNNNQRRVTPWEKAVERHIWRGNGRLRERAPRKLKQMRTYMHHGAFRNFTAGSFHLRPVCFYFSYDELLWSPAVIVTVSPNALQKQRRETDTSMECTSNKRVP